MFTAASIGLLRRYATSGCRRQPRLNALLVRMLGMLAGKT